MNTKQSKSWLRTAVFYISVILWSVVFSSEVQAATPQTWSYVGANLTLLADESSAQCPASVGNLTATFTIPDSALLNNNAYYNVPYTITALGQTFQDITSVIEFNYLGELYFFLSVEFTPNNNLFIEKSSGILDGNDDYVSFSDSNKACQYNNILGTWSVNTLPDPNFIELVDPVPQLLHGSQITPYLTAAGGQPYLADLTKGRNVQGLATDGVAQIVLRIPATTVGEQIDIGFIDHQCSSSDASSCMENYGRLFDPSNPPNDIFSNVQDTSNKITVTAQQTDNGIMAFAAYRAPVDFVRSDSTANTTADTNAAQRSVAINIQSRVTNLPKTIDIQLVRPLVVLVHGLWDDPGHAWKNFGALTSNALFSTVKADYSQPVKLSTATPSGVYSVDDLTNNVNANSLGFEYNATNIINDVDGYLNAFRLGKLVFGPQIPVASAQADFVGHSMGGVVTRTMTTQKNFAPTQTYGKGYIHKLITIGTPHLGSPLGQKLLDPTVQSSNACLQGILGKSGLYAFTNVTATGIASPIPGAVSDLSGDINSTPISKALNNLKNSTFQIPTAMLSGLMSDSQLDGLNDGVIPQLPCTVVTACPAAYLRWKCPDSALAQNMTSTNWPKNVIGKESDAIVPLKSQVNGFIPPVIPSVTAVHSDGATKLGFNGPTELEDVPGVNMPELVISILNSPLSLGGVAVNGDFICLPSGELLPCN